MGFDLLANLYEIDTNPSHSDEFTVSRLLSPDIYHLEAFIKRNFGPGWASEIKAGAYKSNPSVFIAKKGNRILGFAGYDCTCKGFFGPIGVSPTIRSKGIGKALLLATLNAMREDGYAYAIIGDGEGKFEFYQKCCHAIKIESSQTVYSRMLKK
jgi:ribosomal protein S18 acetylase RimI-like enzyme